MRLVLFALLALALAASSTVHAAQFEGVALPDRLTVANEPLVLNGAGMRTKYFFDIYVGALYLPEATTSAEEALVMPGPKAVLLRFVYSEVAREDLVEAWRDGMQANLSAQQHDAIAAELKRFYELFPTVQEGDRLRIEYGPDTGTRVYHNGERLGSIGGEPLAQAWLRTFLGDKAADADLKAGMLQPVANE